LVSGTGHTCAVTTAGAVKCWGANEYGQLGGSTGGGNNSTTPVDVFGLGSGVVAVSAGGVHTCALTTGGGVKCWGRNWEGELGDGTRMTPPAAFALPVDVSNLTSDAATVSAGFYHTCAVTSGVGLKCWGWNRHGEVGDGTLVLNGSNSRTRPVDVSGLGPKATPTATLTPTQPPTNTPPIASTPTRTPPPSAPPGDVNCDGRTNSLDALAVLQLSAGFLSTLPCRAGADVNHDGGVNTLDAALILQYVAGLISQL
jgi:hypothetical protein